MKDKTKEKAQSREDKHTSICKKAYDRGFAEKCAEFDIDPEELVGAMEKVAQTVPTNPATQPGYGLGSYGSRMGTPYDNPNYAKPTQPKNQDPDMGMGSSWSNFAGWESWGTPTVDALFRDKGSLFNPMGYSKEEYLPKGIEATKNMLGNFFGDMGRLAWNSTMANPLFGGNVGDRKDYAVGRDIFDKIHVSNQPGGAISGDKKQMNYSQWKNYTPEQKARFAEAGVTYDPQSEVDYQQQQTEDFRKQLLASGYRQ